MGGEPCGVVGDSDPATLSCASYISAFLLPVRSTFCRYWAHLTASPWPLQVPRHPTAMALFPSERERLRTQGLTHFWGPKDAQGERHVGG